jgi:hypothetical protein
MKLVLIFLTLLCAGCAPTLIFPRSISYSVARRAPFDSAQGKTIVTRAPGYLSHGNLDSLQEASPQHDRLYLLGSQPPWHPLWTDSSSYSFVLAANTKLLVTDIRRYRELIYLYSREGEYWNVVFLTIASGPYSGVKAWTTWDVLPDLQTPPPKD